MYKMQIKTEYRDDEIYGGVFYLTIEADITEDIIDPSSPIIDLRFVQLNGCMALRLNEIPKDINEIIEEQVLQAYYEKRTAAVHG